MKERGKKIVLAVMVIALVIIYFAGSKSAKDAEDETQYNETLFLEIVEDDCYLIGGKGFVEEKDLKKLFKNEKIYDTDLIHLVIGDDITEIGYGCFNGYEYLESIKFGAGIKKIRNGAIRNCKRLKYVFLPSTIEKIGQDFLSGCTDVKFIATDGYGKSIRQVYDFDEYNLVENINSYESLVLAAKEIIKYATFDSSQLESDSVINQENYVRLYKNHTQYGPKTSIKKGKYRVDVRGRALDKLQDEDIFINVGGQKNDLNRTFAVISKNKISYIIDVEKKIDNVEFCIKNNNANVPVDIYGIDIIYEKFDLLEKLGCWWE